MLRRVVFFVCQKIPFSFFHDWEFFSFAWEHYAYKKEMRCLKIKRIPFMDIIVTYKVPQNAQNE